MAFSPIAIFRKHQKFWMAGILIMCMVTFVLCTGSGGELSDTLLRWFNFRHGKAVAKLDGREIYDPEAKELQRQRKVANDFMFNFCKVLVANADKMLLEADEGKKGDDKARQEKHANALYFKSVFGQRLERKPLYFNGDTKLAELMDFKMWLIEADRLGIQLDTEVVKGLVDREFMYSRTKYSLAEWNKVLKDVLGAHPGIRVGYVYDALRNEFRARMAQLAMISSQPEKYVGDFFHHDLKVHGVRAPVSPEQLWDFYRDKRSEFSLALVPVQVEKFLDEVKAPAEPTLEAFFAAHANTPYDPTSAKPGFQKPAEVKVSWITADPESPKYIDPAKVRSRLEVYPMYSPLLPPLVSAATFAAAPQVEKLAYYAHFKLEVELMTSRFRRFDFSSAPLTSNGYLDAIAASQGLDSPQACSSLVAALATPEGVFTALEAFQSVSYFENAKKFDYDLLARLEANRRAPIYAACAAVAGQFPLNLAGTWFELGKIPQSVPLDVVLPKYREAYAKRLAANTAEKFMVMLRSRFEESRDQGQDNIGINSILRDTYKGMPFETKDYYNKYTVQNAKELEPLRKSYFDNRDFVNIFEGRAKGSSKYLGEDDFWKLLFDKNEPFSSAAGKFTVRAWPPFLKGKPKEQYKPADVRGVSQDVFDSLDLARKRAGNPSSEIPFDLFKFGKPPLFLFWISDETKPEVPEKLAEVRDRVLKAWKIEQARDTLALARAEKVADKLQDRANGKEGKLADLADELAKELGQGSIVLRRVAPLEATKTGERGVATTYAPYTLPRDTIIFPRSDTLPQIVGFPKLSAPIKIGFEKLDAVNKKLFEQYKAGKELKTGRRLVQILTNSPQTAFYVAVVATEPEAAAPENLMKSFAESYRDVNDTFVQESFESQAASAYKVLRDALRERLKWEVKDEEAKAFDGSGN